MKNILNGTLITLLISFVLSCTTRNEQETLEAGQAQEVTKYEQAQKYPIDTTISVITWIGSKPTGQHNGTINLSKGDVALLNDTLVGGKFEIAINSLVVMDPKEGEKGNDRLTEHLMSDDFFDAANFPFAYFEVTSIALFDSAALSKDKDQFESDYTPATLSSFMVNNPTHFISGNLTMRGTTKNITFPAEIVKDERKLTAEAKFNIDRTDWNLSYDDEASAVDKATDKFIYNTVNVGFYLEADLAGE